LKPKRPRLEELNYLYEKLSSDEREELLQGLLIAAPRGEGAMIKVLEDELLCHATQELMNEINANSKRGPERALLAENASSRERSHSTVLDAPKLLKDSRALAERRVQIRQRPPHLADLIDFCDRLRGERDCDVPSFDPWDGGAAAQVLFLFESPGPAVKNATGIISRNNPDETAATFFRLSEEAGLDRKLTASWNIVPWYLTADGSPRAPTTSELRDGAAWANKLFALMPRLRYVVLAGRQAEKAEPFLGAPRGTRVMSMPHPSPSNVNRRPQARVEIRSALRRLAEELLVAGEM